MHHLLFWICCVLMAMPAAEQRSSPEKFNDQFAYKRLGTELHELFEEQQLLLGIVERQQERLNREVALNHQLRQHAEQEQQSGPTVIGEQAHNQQLERTTVATHLPLLIEVMAFQQERLRRTLDLHRQLQQESHSADIVVPEEQLPRPQPEPQPQQQPPQQPAIKLSSAMLDDVPPDDQMPLLFKIMSRQQDRLQRSLDLHCQLQQNSEEKARKKQVAKKAGDTTNSSEPINLVISVNPNHHNSKVSRQRRSYHLKMKQSHLSTITEKTIEELEEEKEMLARADKEKENNVLGADEQCKATKCSYQREGKQKSSEWCPICRFHIKPSTCCDFVPSNWSSSYVAPKQTGLGYDDPFHYPRHLSALYDCRVWYIFMVVESVTVALQSSIKVAKERIFAAHSNPRRAEMSEVINKSGAVSKCLPTKGQNLVLPGTKCASKQTKTQRKRQNQEEDAVGLEIDLDSEFGMEYINKFRRNSVGRQASSMELDKDMVLDMSTTQKTADNYGCFEFMQESNTYDVASDIITEFDFDGPSTSAHALAMLNARQSSELDATYSQLSDDDLPDMIEPSANSTWSFFNENISCSDLPSAEVQLPFSFNQADKPENDAESISNMNLSASPNHMPATLFFQEVNKSEECENNIPAPNVLPKKQQLRKSKGAKKRYNLNKKRL